MSIDIDEWAAGTIFTAVYEGQRHRFWAVEHFNEGPGWMCKEIDNKLPNRIYGTHLMADFQDIQIPSRRD